MADVESSVASPNSVEASPTGLEEVEVQIEDAKNVENNNFPPPPTEPIEAADKVVRVKGTGAAAKGEIIVNDEMNGDAKVTITTNGDVNVNGEVSVAAGAEVKVDSTTPVKVKVNGASNGGITVNGSTLKRSSIDDLLPATAQYTTSREDAVKLRMDDTGPGVMKPLTVHTVFKNTVDKAPNTIALGVKRDGAWVKWTYKQYYDDVRRVAKGFIKLGLELYHGVGIVGFNSPEWFMADLGAIFAGGFATGIYTTNTPEACQFVAADCEANILVVENNQQLKKILKVWDNLPHLKAIVQYTGEVAERRDNIYSWSELLALAEEVPDSDLEERLQQQAPNKACTLIYTSGTTGNPKGVMLSHDNLAWTAKYFGRHQGAVFQQEVFVSYLPLSHVAAQMMDLHIPLSYAVSVYFADRDALKGSLVETLREVRPTAFLGVPRVWEKFAEKMQEKSREVKGIKKKIGAWAKVKGKEGVMAKMENRSLPWFWGVANSLLFRPIKKQMGLDRCRICVSGAAPIMKDTLEFFYSFDITVLEVYGMSESTGPHTVGTNECFRLSSVGREIPGVHTKLADKDDDGNGEVCMQGRHVFMGYLNNAEKNAEAFDSDGWLRTGDIGKKDGDNFLYITGRKKELIITAGGENVAPVPVEDSVKEELPVISNCMLIGDKRKFLSMLITLKVLVDPDTGEPTDDLTREAKSWCQSVGSESTKLSDIINDKDVVVLNAIQAGINRANEKAVSRAARIAKWSVLPQDFSIHGGELGPTLKLRRPIVNKIYHKTIETFYAEV
ncbi:long-chain-fatty-acid--CoA ligase ACSBG2-like isoform X2 [Mizuhopecten yessoensis]|uniref:long-chain-fatty-acid--CoA ligase ACSBG2-like isoform X2 n=1 Tax=Mizuhopecten yessoensis TaxID=6573 RepID=UPI000B457581|nr:long-chain-fatty-acid--CoA ligase ACSBG2-like isoform X2 [Mizuhopecten yessoensis]